MSAPKVAVLRLYKALLRESQRISSYNFRNYAIRRTRDAFKENARLSDVSKIQEELSYGQQQLEIIKRQALISQLYKTDKLIIENK